MSSELYINYVQSNLFYSGKFIKDFSVWNFVINPNQYLLSCSLAN